MKIKTLIIDDELPSILALQQDLGRYCPQVDLIGQAQDVFTGIQLIQELKPELIFLDISMPQMNGLDLIKTTPMPQPCRVIMLTAYGEYALQALKLEVTDYLLKPVAPGELLQAIQKVQRHLEIYHKLQLADALTVNGERFPDRLVLPVQHGYEFIVPEEIIYLKADGNYTYIFLKGQRRLHVTRQLHEFQSQLSNRDFYRCHQSYLVRLDQVNKYQTGDGGILIMNNQDQVPISRQHKKDFLTLFKT